MVNPFARNLMVKLVGLFLLVSLVPTVIIGSLAFISGRAALEKGIFERLNAARELRKGQINRYFERTIEDATYLSHSDAAQAAAEKLRPRGGSSGGESPVGPHEESGEQSRVRPQADDIFKDFIEHYGGDAYGYDDVYVVSATSGDLVYSSKNRKDVWTNLINGPYKLSGLARLVSQVLNSGKAAMVDYSLYPPADVPLAFVGVPIHDTGGKVLGVLALSLDSRAVNWIMRTTEDMGRSGQVYLVGRDLLMRSQGRFDSGNSILKRKIDIKAVMHALRNETGTEIMPDDQGVMSLISYSHVGLEENPNIRARFDWAIIADVDSDEAFAEIYVLGMRITLIGISIALLTAVVAYTSARGIAKPITRLSAEVSKVSAGDLTVDVPASTRQDEVGILINAVRTMVESLRDQTGRILEGVNVLASAGAEISATVSQLAASSSETSSAVTETTATLEELRQTGRLSSEKARSVSEDSRKSFQIAQAGKKATDDTIAGMNLIRGQMESIGETVIRLSEQSRSIEEIIGAVKDLAEQSNLLAVNAAIEAARAGEQGKGFAVVAEEIKSLADQSKRATDQVRTILEDIRNSISGVVMATEQGSKAVDSGAKQSSQAGESIEEVTRSVYEASQALTVIVASSEQQSVGVEQVAQAMDSIDQAIRQNVEGNRQLEASARNLDDLGRSLKQLVESYKV